MILNDIQIVLRYYIDCQYFTFRGTHQGYLKSIICKQRAFQAQYRYQILRCVGQGSLTPPRTLDFLSKFTLNFMIFNGFSLFEILYINFFTVRRTHQVTLGPKMNYSDHAYLLSYKPKTQTAHVPFSESSPSRKKKFQILKLHQSFVSN